MVRYGHARLYARRAAAGGALGILLAACSRTQIVQGECRKVNGADICSWGELTGQSLTAFGATVPMTAIQGAPADEPMVWPPVASATIPLPDAVASGTGFKVLTVYWEAHGHPPAPFAVPHWDFHFYNNQTAADVAALDCADSLKPAALAAGYVLPDLEIPGIGMLKGLCVAHMGMHSLPENEYNATKPFEKSMVLGYYHQKSIFVEPMIANAMMLAKKSFTLAMPAVPGMPAGSRYPTQFRADYDSTAQSYRFVFSGFTGGAP